MTLKTGYDVAGIKTIIVNSLNTLKFEDSSSLFPDGILTGEQSQISNYSGVLGFFDMGDLIRIEEGLRHSPAWGVHDGFLFGVIPGETSEAKDTRDDMIRLILKHIEDNPSLNTDGLRIDLADNKPVQRVRSKMDTGNANLNSLSGDWNTSFIINFIIGIAEQP